MTTGQATAPAAGSAWWTLLRPRQWLKNGFVLAPLLFAGAMTSAGDWRAALEATAAFCLVSSSVYILNDLADREKDRQHPLKRRRPLAAGTVGPGWGALLAVACVAAGAAVAAPLPRSFAAWLAAYAGLNVAYTWRLKAVAVADILTIAAGFTVRVLAGSAAIRVPASHWILLCTFLLACFLGSVKRQAEIAVLRTDGGRHRPALHGYTPKFIDQVSSIMLAAGIMSYALYTVSPETVGRIGSDRLIFTLPLVIYGMLRYLQLAHTNLELAGEASLALTADRPLQICIALWIAAASLAIYWH